METFTNFEKLVLNSIELCDYENTPETKKGKIDFVYSLFETEYKIGRYSELKEFENWLSGLPSCFSLPIYYFECLNWADEVGQPIGNEADFCLNFYKNCTSAFFTLKNNL